MKTRIPLEELLLDSPQNRSLIRLFEEDTYNLRSWSHQLRNALDEWCVAQRVATAAASKLAAVIASYSTQKLPLDVAAYDIPSVTSRLAQNVDEIASWMDLLVQQVGFCVEGPIKKAVTELDELVETVRPNYADALSNMADADEKFARASRKDTVRRLEELNNDVFITKMSYHKLSLQYCSRMNMLQSRRYSELVEPLLMLVYAFKCFFNVGHDAFRKGNLTDFLTQAQQHMLTIGKEAEVDRRENKELMSSLSELCQKQHEMYYGEQPVPVPRAVCDGVHKQGYLRIRLKSGLFTNNWHKYYVFTQGAKLMWQKADQLGGSLMLDLTEVPGTSAQVAGESVDRRFVLTVSLPQEEGSGGGERRWLMQARNSVDMHEWVDVINNLAGMQQQHLDDKLGEDGTGNRNAPGEVDTADDHPPTAPWRGPVQELAMQPIQFDLLSICSKDASEQHAYADDASTKYFDVRFLGSLEVVTDQGGDAVVQPAIEQVLRARQAHAIVDSAACRMLVSAHANGLFLVSRDQPDNLKTHLDFADVAFWSAYKLDESVLGMVTRSRTDKSSRPTYMCTVLATEPDTTSADICKALSKASSDSLDNLVRNATVGRNATQMEGDASETERGDAAAGHNATGETEREADATGHNATGETEREADATGHNATGETEREAGATGHNATGETEREADATGHDATGETEREAAGHNATEETTKRADVE